MDAQERYEEILAGFDKVSENDRKAAQYWMENWNELKECVRTIWQETGGEGKPDLSEFSKTQDFILEDYVGEADIALINVRMWQERKKVNEDLLEEFTYTGEDSLEDDFRYAVAECIEKLESLDRALAYVDEWKQNDPDPTYPDAVKISLLFFAKKYKEARLIADPYMDQDPGTVEGSSLLFDMCDNLYNELRDETYLKKLTDHQLAINQKQGIRSRERMLKTTIDIGIHAVENDYPENAAEVWERLWDAGLDKAEAYKMIGLAVTKHYGSDADDEVIKEGISQELDNLAKAVELDYEARRNGRFTSLSGLIFAGNTIKGLESEEPRKEEQDTEAQAARILTPGAFRNLFIAMHDDTINALRRIINDPQTEASEDEQYLLSAELDRCILINREGRVLLADDFVTQFQKLDTPEFNQKRKLNCWVQDCLYMTHHCYGVLKDTDFLKMVSLNGTKITIKEVKKIRQGLPADRRLCMFEGGYVFDDDFAKKKEYARIYAELRKTCPLNMPSADEIDGLYAYGFPHRDPAYKKARAYLRTLTQYPAAADSVLEQTFNRITSSDSFHDALHTITENEDIELNMDPEKLGNIVRQLISETRRWEMLGNRPKDVMPGTKIPMMS